MNCKTIIWVWACLVCLQATAQQKPSGYQPHAYRPVTANKNSLQDSASVILNKLRNISWMERTVCKGYTWVYYGSKKALPVEKHAKAASAKKRLIEVHGNIMYDVIYRSYVDTPYMEKDVYQHTIQTYLDITYKSNYPFRVYLTNRFSNSSLLSNFSDMNFQFNAAGFGNRVRSQLLQVLQNSFSTDSLSRIKNDLDSTMKAYAKLQQWFSGPSLAQRIVRERERKWERSLAVPVNIPMPDTNQTPDVGRMDALRSGRFKFNGSNWLKDTVTSVTKKVSSDAATGADSADFASEYEKKKEQLDSLRKKIAILERLYQRLTQARSRNTGELKTELDQISSGKALHERLNDLNIPDSSLPKGYRALLSLKSIGIGRTMVDYSELSAKNVSITGLQVEYNPSYYAAFAGGVVDYRFRDYIVQGSRKGQYVGLVRYGKGMKEGNNIIFTYYNGKRQFYNSATAGAGSNTPNYNLMGFTIEGKYRINKTSYLTAEIAKSSSPFYSQDSSKEHRILSSAVKMNDHTNEAYSLKFTSYIRYTQTQIDAKYRRVGANFQSFSIYSIGSSQSAWSARIDQSLFHRHVNVTGSVRVNDFTNPFTNIAYKSSTVFKSIQATVRLKKLPTVSLGYFPSSQVTKMGDDHFQENLFYTLVGSANHFYTVRQATMLTTLVYTQFFNKVTDTNFVYFNTKNALLNQSAYLGRLSLQLQLSAAVNNSYELYVIENSAQYKLSSWLSLGGGIKYNRQTLFNTVQWGYSGRASVKVPKIGEFQMVADKGFIPGRNRQLVENRIGRLTYLKIF